MWSPGDRPELRDADEPCATEIGRTVAAAYEPGDAIDARTSALRSTHFDPFILASLRTPADEAAAEAALETALTTCPPSAEVLELAADRRRRAIDEPRAA